MSLHINSANYWLPSMFVSVQERVTVGVLVGFAGSSITGAPLVTDQSESKTSTQLVLRFVGGFDSPWWLGHVFYLLVGSI